MASNKVISGDYVGYKIAVRSGMLTLSKFLADTIEVSPRTVENYEVKDNDKVIKSSSGAARAGKSVLGAAILGPLGLLAGAGTGTKSRNEITLAIYFRDGRRSLIECDQEIYSAFMKVFF